MTDNDKLDARITHAIRESKTWIPHPRTTPIEWVCRFASLSTKSALLFDSDDYREWAEPIIYAHVSDSLVRRGALSRL